MPARTAKFVSAIFASILAGIPLATVSHGATPAADDCLSGPKDPAPNGSHWYYRIDHATKRHCWYLKDEKPSQSAAASSSPSAKPASPSAETTTQRSIADAHAELPAQAAIEQPKRGDGLARPIAADATIATPAPAAETQRSAVASRWPEQSGTGSSTVPPSTAPNSDAAAPPDPDAAPSAAPAAVAFAAADSSPEKQPGSIQTLLLVILSALALAGLIGSAVFRFGNLRWIGRRTIQVDRQAIWETANIHRRSPPVDLDSGARIRRDDIPWELRTADDPNGRIEEMLARLARSATN
jgi:hypothetical protein